MNRLLCILHSRLIRLVAVALAGWCVWRIVAVLPLRVHTIDFSHYYVSSRVLLEGLPVYSTPLATYYAKYGFEVSARIPYATNPPGLLWLFVPFALLPPGGAMLAWTLVQALALAVILWLTMRLLDDRLAHGRDWIICAVLTSPVLLWHFGFAQTQLLLAALVLAGYVQLQRGRSTVACILVTIAGVIKLYPFVLLPWFLWRSHGSWAVRGKRLMLVAGLITLTVLATGPGRWWDFEVYAVPYLQRYAVESIYNFSLPSFMMKLGCLPDHFHPTDAVAELWSTCGIGVGMLLLVAGYGACARWGGSLEMEFCWLSVVMLVGGMMTWGHYLVFLIFPMAVACAQLAGKTDYREWLIMGLAFVLLNNLYNINRWETPFLKHDLYLKLLVNSLPLAGMLLVARFFLRQMINAKQPSRQGA